MRLILAGILAGVVMFMWGGIAHMALPLGKMGIQSLPGEETVLSALQTSIPADGLYFFPGMDMSRKPTPDEQRAWEAKYMAGPHGIIVYHGQGSSPLSPRQLLVELVANILACIVAALVLTRVVAGFGSRVMAATGFGLIAWLSVSASYWIWYGFPRPFALAEAVDQVVGWFLAGLVLAALLRVRTVAHPRMA
jgi:hypothetical protein